MVLSPHYDVDVRDVRCSFLKKYVHATQTALNHGCGSQNRDLKFRSRFTTMISQAVQSASPAKIEAKRIDPASRNFQRAKLTHSHLKISPVSVQIRHGCKGFRKVYQERGSELIPAKDGMNGLL